MFGFFELVQRLRGIKYIYDDDGVEEEEYELATEEEKEEQEETKEIVLWEDEEEDDEEEDDYKGEEVGGSQLGTATVSYKDFHISKAPTSAFSGHCPRFMKAK